MTYKILLIAITIFFFSATTAMAATDPNNVDPEKEQVKKKATVIKDSFQKDIYIKGQMLPIEEPTKAPKDVELKEEKKQEASKEEVQSFNFLYYMLQSKVSDFITY